jgi:hypothetical protein
MEPEKGMTVVVKEDVNRNLIMFYKGWKGKITNVTETKIFISFKDMDKDSLPFATDPAIKVTLNPMMMIKKKEFDDILEIVTDETDRE